MSAHGAGKHSTFIKKCKKAAYMEVLSPSLSKRKKEKKKKRKEEKKKKKKRRDILYIYINYVSFNDH